MMELMAGTITSPGHTKKAIRFTHPAHQDSGKETQHSVT